MKSKASTADNGASTAILLTPAVGAGPHSAELRAAGVEDRIWQAEQVLEGVAGRGNLRRIELTTGPAVVRHYRRGGAAARWFGDRYWFVSAATTRSFREFRLLEQMRALELPVPQPLAARYLRSGPWYRADLAMSELPESRSLHVILSGRPAQLEALATSVGAVLARFHRCGIWHADLNAHNILINTHGTVFLVDFDRGELRTAQSGWQQQNLQRLHRSLLRLGHLETDDFVQRFWQPLVSAHSQELRQ